MKEKTIGATDTRHLIVLLYIVGLDTTMPDKEWHSLSYMDALFHWCQMVWEHGDADGILPRAYLFIYWRNESLVQILNGFEFQFKVAVMTSLVARLNMDEHEVIVTQRLDGSLSLSFVVGISKTGGALP